MLAFSHLGKSFFDRVDSKANEKEDDEGGKHKDIRVERDCFAVCGSSALILGRFTVVRVAVLTGGWAPVAAATGRRAAAAAVLTGAVIIGIGADAAIVLVCRVAVMIVVFAGGAVMVTTVGVRFTGMRVCRAGQADQKENKKQRRFLSHGMSPHEQ